MFNLRSPVSLIPSSPRSYASPDPLLSPLRRQPVGSTAADVFADARQLLSPQVASPSCSPSKLPAQGSTPLHQAAFRGDVLRLRQLLSAQSYRVDALDEDAHTALQWAVLYGHKSDAVQLLLSHGADPTASSAHSSSPLQCVLSQLPGMHPSSSHAKFLCEAASLLLAHGADLHADPPLLPALVSLLDASGCVNLILRTVLQHAHKTAATLSQCRDAFEVSIGALVEGGVEHDRVLPVLETLMRFDPRSCQCTALHRVLRSKCLSPTAALETVQWLIGAGADPSECDRFGRTVLWPAVDLRNLSLVKLLLEAGCTRDAEDDSGATVLDHLLESVDWAGRRRIEPSLEALFMPLLGVNDDTAIAPAQIVHRCVRCCRSGHELALQLLSKVLMRFPDSVNEPDSKGCTPLMVLSSMASSGQLHPEAAAERVFRTLKTAEVDARGRDHKDQTALHYFVSNMREAGEGLCSVVLRWLLEMIEVPINTRDSEGRTALLLAVQLRHTQLVGRLCKHGASIGLADNQGATAVSMVLSLLIEEQQAAGPTEASSGLGRSLMLALNKGSSKPTGVLHQACSVLSDGPEAPVVLRFLLSELKCRVNEPSSQGESPIHVAARRGSELIASVLLKARAQLDALDHHAETAAIVAARGGHRGVVKLLCGSAGLLDEVYNGTNVLLEAVKRNEPDWVASLVQSKASVQVVGASGKTALTSAIQALNHPIAGALLHAQHAAMLQDPDGRTALHTAVARAVLEKGTVLTEPRERALAMLKLVLAAGESTPNHLTVLHRGMTPLQVAIDECDCELVSLLLLRHRNAIRGDLIEELFSKLDKTRAALRAPLEAVGVVLVRGGLLSEDALEPLLRAVRVGSVVMRDAILESSRSIGDAAVGTVLKELQGAVMGGAKEEELGFLRETAELLVGRGLPLSCPSRDGSTPLYLVYQIQDYDLLMMLLEKGLSLGSAVDPSGCPLAITMVRGAASGNRVPCEGVADTVSWLMERGCSPCLQDPATQTTMLGEVAGKLSSSDQQQQPEVEAAVCAMLNTGVVPSELARDVLWSTMSEESASPTVLAALVQSASANKVQGAISVEELALAVEKQQPLVLDTLLANRGDPNGVVPVGEHPVSLLHLASKAGAHQITSVLLQRGAHTGRCGAPAKAMMAGASANVTTAFAAAFSVLENPLAPQQQPGWISKSGCRKVLGSVLTSLGFDIGDGSVAKGYADACFQSVAPEQQSLWVDDVAQYAAHVSKSIQSMSLDEAAATIQRAWKRSPRKDGGCSPRPERVRGEMSSAERAALARSGLLWHVCQAVEQSFGELDGQAGKAGLLSKDGLTVLLRTMLSALGFEKVEGTEYLGSRYVAACWSQYDGESKGTVEIGEVVDFIVTVWQQTLGMEMAVALLSPAQNAKLQSLQMSPSMVIGEFWKHVRPGTALVRSPQVVDVLEAYLKAYRLGGVVDISQLADSLGENVSVQEFTDVFLEMIAKIINHNYSAAMGSA